MNAPRSYYNEIDPYAAQWLGNLAAAGHIAPGEVDTRSIVDLRPADVAGYRQCHFFAGIAGWSLALRLAGWPDDREVWTGSCPCQPFSAAGQRKGFDDERHLWPAWFRLIRECRPAAIFGEQVTSPLGLGWLDHVQNDLEAIGYACAAALLRAGAFGAPHDRPRLWFVAYPNEAGRVRLTESHVFSKAGQPPSQRDNADGCGISFWSSACLMEGADSSRRRIEPGLQPLAHGLPARVGKLRAAGNAIVPQVAAAFIASCLEVLP